MAAPFGSVRSGARMAGGYGKHCRACSGPGQGGSSPGHGQPRPTRMTTRTAIRSEAKKTEALAMSAVPESATQVVIVALTVADGLGSAQRLREHISVGEAGAASASERQALHLPVAVRSRSCLRHHPRCPLGLDVDEAGGGERAASRSARTTRPGASAGMASRRRRMSSARQPAAVSGTTSPGTSARIPRAAGWRSTASTAGSSPEGDALPRTPDGGPAGPVVSGGGAGGAGSAAPQPAAAVERVLVRP